MYTFCALFLLLLPLAANVLAATVTFDWTIDWVTAAPDGYSRPVIGINRQWPCPIIQANQGDTIIVNIQNNLGNETTGLHFHGIRQYGTPEMDGPIAASQCSVPPGSSFTYQFQVDQPGTYWYHSHEMGQYPDGLRGPLIVHDPDDPYKGQVDEEVIMTVSDCQTIPLVQTMLQPNNTEFIPPLPNSVILNEGGSNQIPFQKGKTYRIRMINFSALTAAMITFQSQTMKIIMQDGSYITEADADLVRLDCAQRYDVLLTSSSSSSNSSNDESNYPFLIALDVNKDYTNPNASPQPISWNHNETGYLVVNPNNINTTSVDIVHAFDPVDDAKFTNANGDGPWGPVTQTIQLDFNFCFDNNSIPRACLNGQPYVDQRVPTLYTAATTDDDNTDPVVYGAVNPFIVEQGQVVDIVLNNLDTAIHPFHLHGHQFQVIARPPSGTGQWPGTTDDDEPAYPPSRDTVSINGASYAVLRFKADNPGVWLFHCHIEWHVEMGLTATIVEGPEQLRGLQIPEDHIEACKAQGAPYEGNAAGNTANYTDTAGMLFVNPATYTG
ncbi:hypothetical protein M406DRAFT_268538 [Cryphonectria parasitica EP155]|uniref:Laccase n=1 Tax=Cryphonectria parasitica (strain ATCC 38755 / EP155) TaxID=660469 RepID=A0A9P4XTT4_CRYP1|nr:uncharacterized protein M406DRAFT_268538 [Cryphonectria parasitica EP155]KAF3760530.1 hypothetical protein M406DRAFT_268538 [Cryphonectria parasitica EP155]